MCQTINITTASFPNCLIHVNVRAVHSASFLTNDYFITSFVKYGIINTIVHDNTKAQQQSEEDRPDQGRQVNDNYHICLIILTSVRSIIQKIYRFVNVWL